MKCSTSTCQTEARYVIFWPGTTPPHSRKCLECLWQAQGVARTMGFELAWETCQAWLEKTVERLKANDAVRRLSAPSEG